MPPRTSPRLSLVTVAKPLITGPTPAELAPFAVACFLIKSAHDFGATGTGATVSATASATAELDWMSSPSRSGFEFDDTIESRWDLRAAIGLVAITGTTGITGPVDLPCLCRFDASRNNSVGGTAVDLCVEVRGDSAAMSSVAVEETVSCASFEDASAPRGPPVFLSVCADAEGCDSAGK